MSLINSDMLIFIPIFNFKLNIHLFILIKNLSLKAIL